jgi:putative colanic acid biosynthesis UDP-glucose lipid carrier transferase
MNQNKEIYKFGNFLRRSNLDEIPQFFNVFLGSMSVVGPRPHDFDEDIFFNSKISKYKIRYSIKPGITGLAGINGNRGGTDLDVIEERVNFDVLYTKKQSFLYDLKIVLITIFLTLTGKKSI